MKAKKIIKISSISLIIIVIISFIAGAVMLNIALKPEQDSMQWSRAYICKEYPYLVSWLDSAETNAKLRDTSIINREGKKLVAKYMPAAHPSHKTAVILHGYTDNAYLIMQLGYMYHHDLGYNILIPNHQNHGDSEGENVQMGWLDRLDALEWMKVANQSFPNSSMLVHGISMGAACTMMLSGEKQENYVKCFIEDCGFTSVWDQFKKELKSDFGLPPFPILHAANLLCKIKYGWCFKEASAQEQLKHCTLPMLFIHGTADNYVPTWMLHPLYESHPGTTTKELWHDAPTKKQNASYDPYPSTKEFWLVEGAAHAVSYKCNPKEYTQKVKDFAEKYME